MSNELQTGDVIEIKEGMEIYASIPERFVYSNRRFSKGKTQTYIRIGEVRRNKVHDVESVKASIATKIQEAFSSSSGFNISSEAAKNIVESILPEHAEEQYDGSDLKGEYLVIRTAFEGGSDGRDWYPNGHHVFAKKLKDGKYDPEGIEISFYQSGEFTAMILPSEIQPIRKMTMTFM